MSGCLDCGRQTPYQLCRACERERRFGEKRPGFEFCAPTPDDAYLTEDAPHWCDVCNSAFDSLEALADHQCALSDGSGTSTGGSDRSEWDETWARIREMEIGSHDPLPEFQETVNDAMEDVGNKVSRPLVMKVSVKVVEGGLAEPGDRDD